MFCQFFHVACVALALCTQLIIIKLECHCYGQSQQLSSYCATACLPHKVNGSIFVSCSEYKWPHVSIFTCAAWRRKQGLYALVRLSPESLHLSCQPPQQAVADAALQLWSAAMHKCKLCGRITHTWSYCITTALIPQTPMLYPCDTHDTCTVRLNAYTILAQEVLT